MSQEEMTAVEVFRAMFREELDIALGPLRLAIGRLENKLGEREAHEQAAQDAGVISARRAIQRRQTEILRQHGAKIPDEEAAPAEPPSEPASAPHAPPPLRRPKKPKLCSSCEGPLVFDGERNRCTRCE